MAPKPPNLEELPPPCRYVMKGSHSSQTKGSLTLLKLKCSRRRNPSDAVRWFSGNQLLRFFPFSVSVIDWNVIDDLIPVGEDPEEDSKADSVEKKEESDSTFENSTIAVTSTAEIIVEPPNNKTYIRQVGDKGQEEQKNQKQPFPTSRAKMVEEPPNNTTHIGRQSLLETRKISWTKVRGNEVKVYRKGC
ncbi:uncharacterized protein LOC114268117 [Camellia sinensis]|uniref:uncharacterized protein LOC114268117 n=1 Tax=Camellia sinensis TaxID=4442 RepID=UPI0010358160|nr:uncharacterized protein LOC114268117 [Camellia sinensis]